MMTPAIRPLIAVLLLVFATGSLAAKKKRVAPPAPLGPTPCVDFYGHVNFNWLLSHPLPTGMQSFSRWDELNLLAEQRTRDLLSSPGSTNPGVASNLLANLVASSLDQSSLDTTVRTTAQPLLAQIDAIRKPKDIPRVIASLHAAGVPVVFGFEVLRDADTGQPRSWFYPGGFGLPDSAYYISTEPELQRAVALYRNYLGELLRFAGVSEAKIAEQAGWAFVIEQSLALSTGSSNSETFIIDAQKKNPYPMPWMADFVRTQAITPPSISVQQPAFFRALDSMLVKPSVPQWQAYLRTQVLHSFAPAMARDLRLPYLSALKMVPESTASIPASDRLARLSQHEGAELLSAAYAETHLKKADEQRADAIGEAIRASMGRAIDRAAWLSAEGKAASKTKLAAMRLAIGKPTEPVSFAGLSFDRHNYAGNVLALRRWNRLHAFARLNSAIWPWPVSQTQPAIGYQAAENLLIVTASALNPPAFEARSTAWDYGSFGALVAQQMSLGFADFTESDGRGLAYRQAGLIAQFNAYPAGSMANVDGARMQRQNAADLAAIEIALDALNAQGATDQLSRRDFFQAWASVWARQESPASLAAAQTTSAFSPAKWRVNGPLVNTPAFAQTFKCKAGQPMFKAAQQQLAIWR
jgi:putative endopeptidase